MCITFSIRIFCNVFTIYQNIFATLTWKFFQVTPNTLVMHLSHINIITYHKSYNLSLNTFVRSSFPKGITLYMGENNVKEIMYRVLHVIAMYIMGIDVVRLGISLNKCI